MKIISHRGFWNNDRKKNSIEAFKAAFEIGTGIETDIRDFGSRLVISHDIPNENCFDLANFFDLYNNSAKNYVLALNVKSDGLASEIKKLLIEYNIDNYFVFDMSIPDNYIYLKNNVDFFTRQSEFEPDPAFYKETKGIWLDSFIDQWYDESLIKKHLENNKKLCIVSSELHRRDHQDLWNICKQFEENDNLYLCTDYPLQANKFFNLK